MWLVDRLVGRLLSLLEECVIIVDVKVFSEYEEVF